MSQQEYQATVFGGLVVFIGLLLVLRLVRRVVAAGRTPTPIRAPSSVANVVDVTEMARRSRWQGSVLTGITYVLAASAIATLAAFPSVDGLIQTFFFIAMPRLIGRAVRYGRNPALMRRLWVVTRGRVWGAIFYFLATALMVFCLLTVTGGFRVFFGARLELRDGIGLTDDQVTQLNGEARIGLIMVLLGVLLLGVTPLLIRVARRQSQLHASAVRGLDHRPATLYLRSFGDDRLMIPATGSSRRPAIEILWPTVLDRFEAVVAWAMDNIGPPVSIARPDTRLANIGAAREYAPDEGHWIDYVSQLIGDASAVVVSVAASDGLMLELNAITQSDALNRTVFVFPPLRADELEQRWSGVRSRLADQLDHVPPVPAGSLLAAVVQGRALVGVTATRRDEAAYAAALGQAFGVIGAGRPIGTAGPST